MSDVSESVIVCEGFHDRAFIAGWLTHHGWVSAKDRPYAPLGKKLTGGGMHGFSRTDGGWLRVVPAMGDSEVVKQANVFAADAKTRPIANILLVWDDDRDAAKPDVDDRRQQAFDEWARKVGATAKAGTLHFELQGEVSTVLSHFVWRTAGDAPHDLPQKQTLERVVCKAIVAVYPERGLYVGSWLARRPSPPDESSGNDKAHAASHMAGWFAEHGSEDFYRRLWDDPLVAAKLEEELAASGAARVLGLLEGV